MRVFARPNNGFWFITGKVTVMLVRTAVLILALTLTSSALWAQTDTPETVAMGSTAQLWQPGDAGEKLFIRGRVLDNDGVPLAGVIVNLRQADGDGEYHSDRYRATLQTDQKGEYQLRTVLPGQYYSAKHIHISFALDGFMAVQTEILFKGDPALDPVTERDQAVVLETAVVGEEEVRLGQFEVTLKAASGQ
jgi:protocatechuate 3,4-dioxygenase beta subunit